MYGQVRTNWRNIFSSLIFTIQVGRKLAKKVHDLAKVLISEEIVILIFFLWEKISIIILHFEASNILQQVKYWPRRSLSNFKNQIKWFMNAKIQIQKLQRLEPILGKKIEHFWREIRWVPIYIYKVKWITVVEGDPKAPFSLANTPRSREGRHSFPWIAPLYP